MRTGTCLQTTKVLLAVVVSTLLASCGTSGGTARTRPEVGEATVAKIDHESWSKLGYRLDWQGFPFSGLVAHPKVVSLTPYQGFVLVQESGSNVSFLEGNTGARRWTVELGNELTRFVGLSADPADPQRILVSSESELFTIAAANGNIIGRESFARVVNTAPVHLPSLAVYGTSVGEVLAHRVGSGIKAWGFAARGGIDANPVKTDNCIGVVTQTGQVLMFSTGGTILGRASIHEGLATNPVTDGQHIFMAGLDQSLWAFDERGDQMWRYRTSAPLRVQPAVFETSVLCEVPELGLTAFETATGNIKWSSKTVHGTVVAVRSGRLVVWDGTTANLVDAARGDVLASVRLPGVERITTDKFVDGNLFVVTSEGSVAKFLSRS